MGNGQKATGSPIKIGAIVTVLPGLDFSPETKAAAAFFDCVNANGGINGRPIQYLVKTEPGTDPAKVAAAGNQLVTDDKVDGMVGDMSLLDCTVNQKLYQSNGLDIIDAGVAAECYTTPNSAPVNMGPRYSSDGAAQTLIGMGVKKIVIDTPNVPGASYITDGPVALADEPRDVPNVR